MGNIFLLRCTWVLVKVTYFILPIIKWLLKAAMYLIGAFILLCVLLIPS